MILELRALRLLMVLGSFEFLGVLVKRELEVPQFLELVGLV